MVSSKLDNARAHYIDSQLVNMLRAEAAAHIAQKNMGKITAKREWEALPAAIQRTALNNERLGIPLAITMEAYRKQTRGEDLGGHANEIVVQRMAGKGIGIAQRLLGYPFYPPSAVQELVTRSMNREGYHQLRRGEISQTTSLGYHGVHANATN